MRLDLFLVPFFLQFFCLPRLVEAVSFLLHVKYTLLYHIVLLGKI